MITHTVGLLVDSPKGRGQITDIEGVLVRVNDYWHLWTECTPVSKQAVEDTATAATAGEREAVILYTPLGEKCSVNGDVTRTGYVNVVLENGYHRTYRLSQLGNVDAYYSATITNLQAELATARKQVAELTGAIKTALEFVSSAWDKNDASVVVKDYRYLTETLNFTEAALQDVLFKSDEK